MDRRLSRYNDSSRRYSEASGDADLPPEDMRPIYYSEEAAPPLSVSPSASIARTGAQHGVSGGDAVAALKIGVDGFGHMAPPTLSSTSPSHRLSTTAVSEGSRTLPPLPSLPSSSHFLGEPRTLPALGSNLQPAPPNHPLPHPLRPHRPASASVSFPTSTDGLLPGWDQNRPRASSASVTITLSERDGRFLPHKGTVLAHMPDSPSQSNAGGIAPAAVLSRPVPHMLAPQRAIAGDSTSRQSLFSELAPSDAVGQPAEPSSLVLPHNQVDPSTVPSGITADAPQDHMHLVLTGGQSDTKHRQVEGGSIRGPGRSHEQGIGGADGVNSNLRGLSASTRQPSLNGFAREQDGRRYQIIVVQSPSRARMCGFGDKDRRPLSPTLIVKLIITNLSTGRESAPTDVDTSSFFLAADLVHPEELDLSPRNLLVHQHAATVSTSMLQQQANPDAGLSQNSGPPTWPVRPDMDSARSRSFSDPWSAQGALGTPLRSYDTAVLSAGGANAPYTTIMTETYTRNFVGASVASANILKDERDQLGIFFVLQDLSVRTEGVYRIKLMLANLSGENGQIKPGASESLAEAYTEPFTVYTPRRFPGVIEPTALSKKFAAQGVKIPVRVDRKKRRRDSAGFGGLEGEGGDGSGGMTAFHGGGSSVGDPRDHGIGADGDDGDDGDDD